MEEREDVEDKTTNLIRSNFREQEHGQRANRTTVYTCPECGGTLWQVTEQGLMQFHCHVGHVYGVEMLLGSMSEELEAALWRAVRLLAEKATLARQLSERLQAGGHHTSARRLEDQASDDDRQGQIIRDVLSGAQPAGGPTGTIVEVLDEASDEASTGLAKPQS
jgi:two-component system chemotaxis response regulator CheB